MHQYLINLLSRFSPTWAAWPPRLLGVGHRIAPDYESGPDHTKAASPQPSRRTRPQVTGVFFFFFTENSGCILMVLELHAKDKQPYAVQRDMFAHCRVPPPHQTRYGFPPRGHTPLRHHNSQVAANHVTHTEIERGSGCRFASLSIPPPSVPVPAAQAQPRFRARTALLLPFCRETPPVPPTRWGFARAEIARPVDAAERGGEKRHSRSRRAARTGTAVITAR